MVSRSQRFHAPGWPPGKPVGELGEFGLIARLREQVGRAAIGLAPNGGAPVTDALPDRPELVGIGDDAAVLRPPAAWDLLLTCDTLVEGRHFRAQWLSARELGARAAEVNLSDIAAMGGLPEAALISLGLPPELSVEMIDEIYTGLLDALSVHGARIIGGNIARTERLHLDVTLMGRVEKGTGLFRRNAKAGDILFVTGHPGRAGAALAALSAEESPAGEAAGASIWQRLAEREAFAENLRAEADAAAKASALASSRASPLAAPGASTHATPGTSPLERSMAEAARERIRRPYAVPRARIEIARYLLRNGISECAIDLSDGLAGDAAHLCEESGVGIVLEELFLPIHEDLRHIGELRETDPLVWVLGPSDDYELLFTASPGKADAVFALAGLFGVPVSPLGSVVAEPGGVRLRHPDGSFSELAGGWDHLRAGAWPEKDEGE
ncbi:MAG: thiamine-monophosphate kinase [Candidatus Eisenbacteria bacterium]|nr:thiamine-monophosphate kinase [Candidatus Eisenbacteria bacterium]